jgi:hypothetical protein
MRGCGSATDCIFRKGDLVGLTTTAATAILRPVQLEKSEPFAVTVTTQQCAAVNSYRLDPRTVYSLGIQKLWISAEYGGTIAGIAF